jgi:hypothetical protein
MLFLQYGSEKCDEEKHKPTAIQHKKIKIVST